MRRKETLKFITKLAKDACDGFTRVELRTRLTNMTFEIMTRMVAGDAKEMKKFKDMINEMMPLLGANNMGDFVPIIRLIDFGGLVKRMKDVAKKGNSFLQGIIDEIRSEKHGGNNMLQHLLTLQKSQPEYYSDVIIKGIIQCFEWKRLTQEEVDMTESKIGLVMEKLNPLETMCKARPIIKKVIKELNI
ncbi:hypothetical protein TSUD_82390 [Trifolium subterraneum]|uniref:Uncharacterized protein n=1 Tax=Trifolium subterraneum TaxID=3900 RepID=A0A2Z6PGN8_TRISU|nr:hypothetical protein TSUD_82390 [Trifolium subterraneum]